MDRPEIQSRKGTRLVPLTQSSDERCMSIGTEKASVVGQRRVTVNKLVEPDASTACPCGQVCQATGK